MLLKELKDKLTRKILKIKEIIIFKIKNSIRLLIYVKLLKLQTNEK